MKERHPQRFWMSHNRENRSTLAAVFGNKIGMKMYCRAHAHAARRNFSMIAVSRGLVV